MCGIVGYTGKREAGPLLLEGLARLEYRGYDSAGVAIQNGRGLIVTKLAGRVVRLRERLDSDPVHGVNGIAHTRWATHGAPTERNAHPHQDCAGEVAVVHNGIIENADALRTRLERSGHEFASETDTEVLAHLIEEAPGGTLEERVIAALSHVEGTYGLAVMSSREPHKVVVARKGSPLLIGVGDGEYFVASDASAVLGQTRTVVYLDDGDIAVLTPEGYRILDHDEREQVRSVDDIEWDLEAIELGGYAHFMLKEICEQPETVHSTLRGRLLFEEGTARLNGLGLPPGECREISRIVIVACGTSWHAGLVGRHVLEELTGLPVQVEYASEYRYRRQLRIPGTLTIAVSQSGETADTLEAIRAARGAGARVVGIVNVVGSTIARETDGGIYLHAGPEIGVASTKAFTSQVVAFLLLAVYIGRQRGLSFAEGRSLVHALAELPQKVRGALALEPAIKELAGTIAHAPNALYLGRGVNFPVALEGALKLKEISYIHAEGYPAAEMKHGPIALIDENVPVIVVAPKDDLFEKTVSNMQEVATRGGQIILISDASPEEVGCKVAAHIGMPSASAFTNPLIYAVPVQLLAYHTAVIMGTDVDQPRNLAKSVTVE